MGLGFLRYSQHTLAPVFTPAGSMAAIGSGISRASSQSEKSEKDLDPSSYEFPPVTPYEFANGFVYCR